MPHNSQSVYADLKKRIMGGQVLPGASLREAEQARQYGVSRNTVKRALLMLERDRLITIEPNKGARVQSFSLEEVLQFLELRQELEGFITRRAAGAIGDLQLEELATVLGEMQAFAEAHDLLSYSQRNAKFHEIIYAACPNALAVEVIAGLKNQMLKYNTRTILVPGRSEESFAEHAELFQALKARDPARAEEAMRMHLEHIRKVFQENFTLLFGWIPAAPSGTW